MALKNYIGLFFLLFFGLSACQSNEMQGEATTAEDQLIVLKQLEDSLGANLEEMNTELADSTVDAFVAFSKDFESHPQAPVYLFKAGEIRLNQKGKSLYGIEIFQDLKDRFKDHELAANATFMIPMAFDAILNDEARAIKGYRDFLNQYPNHQLAIEAQNLLRIKERSPDDLSQVKDWLKKAEGE